MKKRILLFFGIVLILSAGACKTFDFTDSYRKTEQDDTAVLQALLNGAGSEIKIPQNTNGQPYIVSGVKLENLENKNIHFAAGVRVFARAQAFKGEQDCLLSIVNCKNVNITGYGATLQMRKADYKRLGYRASKTRHAVSISASENIRLEGFKICQSGGDGIYIGNQSAESDIAKIVDNKNIQLINLNIENNYRYGISVSSANGLLIDGCSVIGTNGLVGSDGLHFEPADNSISLQNIRVKNSAFLYNRCSGIKITLSHAQNIPLDISFENCCSDKNIFGSLAVMQVPKTFKGIVRVINCDFKGVQFIRVPREFILSESH